MKRTLIGLVVTAICLAGISAGPVAAQCNTTIIPPYAYTSFSSTAVKKWFTGDNLTLTASALSSCMLVASSNANCPMLPLVIAAPGSKNCPTTMICKGVLARAPTGSPTYPRFCMFNCGICGFVVVHNIDGLPIELLDFKINDGQESNTKD